MTIYRIERALTGSASRLVRNGHTVAVLYQALTVDEETEIVRALNAWATVHGQPRHEDGA